MSRYNFDLTIDRRKAFSRKWEVLPDEIALTVADTDYQVMDEIQEEVSRINYLGRFGYTYPDESYFKSYIKWWSTRYQASFKVEDCLFSTGVVASIDSILKRITNKGDNVMMFTPIYNVFYNCIKNNNLNLLDCPFIYQNHQYSIDWDLFNKNIKNTKVFLLCNPHNPTGMMFNEEEINKISEICRENNIFLLSDEIHSDIDYNEQKYVSTLKSVDYDKLIVFLSPGKTFNLAGLHSSIVVIKNKDLREKIQNGLWEDDIGEPSYFSVSPVSVAYNQGEEYVYELNEYLKINRDLVKEFISKYPKLHLINNTHTYLLWIDISEYKVDSESFANSLREKEGLVVGPGKKYGDDRFIRINIATSKEVLEEALIRLERFIKTL